MKESILIIWAALLISTGAFAEEEMSSPNPQRAHRLSLGYGVKGVGTDYGSEVSLTTPYFSNERFAVKFAWDYMNFGSGPGERLGEITQKYYNAFLVDFLWSSWVTERVRGFLSFGLGVIPLVAGVTHSTSLSGDTSLGLEYFPSINAKWSFAGKLGATTASILGSSHETPSDRIFRAPYGSGVTAVAEVRFYPF